MYNIDPPSARSVGSVSDQNYILNLEEISSGYGSVQVLHELNFNVLKGEFVAIIGANGAGKTTLMKLIAGVQPIWGGKLRFNGVDIGDLSAPQRVKAGLALVPEGRKIFPKLTVQENLILVLSRKYRIL